MAHRQMLVKVNGLIDVGIAELVQILNEFPGIYSIESCQGSPRISAWVCFGYGNSFGERWQPLARFVFGFLGPRLAREIGDRASLAIQVTGSGHFQAELTVRPGNMKTTINALQKLRKTFVNQLRP